MFKIVLICLHFEKRGFLLALLGRNPLSNRLEFEFCQSFLLFLCQQC